MKGLYLNVEGARARVERLARTIGAPTAIATASHDDLGEVLVDHHPADWPGGPVLDDPGTDLFAAASGWFVFRGRLGDLDGFARAFAAAAEKNVEAQVAREVSAGEFVLLLVAGGERYLVTDPFGLHGHYFVDGDTFGTLAPTAAHVKGDRGTDPVPAAIVRKMDRLYGNLTAYTGVERLEPGAIITQTGVERYFDYSAPGGELADVPALLAKGLEPFAGRTRVLPLSGGLDSRLLLAACGAEKGYTFGPADTGDRPVARLFADRFDDYWELSFLELEYPERFQEACRMLLDGTMHAPFNELLVVNARLFERWGDGCVLLDGFCGDVLQRGTYLTCGGVRGSLAKLVPWLTTRDFDPMTVLRGRTAALSDEEFELVARTYRETTGGWTMDDLHKLLLFEIVYGKGTHLTTQGGIMAGQYFTNVRPFFVHEVFRALFSADLADAMNHRTLAAIWSKVPPEYTGPRTYSGYRPTGHPHLGRASMLVHKALARWGLGPTVNYTSELGSVVWR